MSHNATTEDGRIAVERRELTEDETEDILRAARQRIQQEREQAVEWVVRDYDLTLDAVETHLQRGSEAVEYAFEDAAEVRAVETHEQLGEDRWLCVHVETKPESEDIECIAVETRT